jgi:hypothetical protein
VIRTKEQIPTDRPMSDAEWSNYLAELAMQQLVEEYGPILQEDDDEQ